MTHVLRFLASEEAFALRREHAAPPGSPPVDPLRLAAALRRALPAERARALAEQIELERRAYAKFADRRPLLFERVALEQATSPGIARFHAVQAVAAAGEGARVVDLGCGLGADAMAFAEAGCRVVAVDRDASRARLAAHNLAAHDLAGRGLAPAPAVGLAPGAVAGGALAVRGDAAALPARGDVLFADPDRRSGPPRRGSGGRSRALRLTDTSPAWEDLAALAPSFRGVLVKAPPALPDGEIPPDAAVDFLSEGGECREALLRLGEGVLPGSRRAVRVDASGGASGPGLAIRDVASGPPAPVAPPGAAAPFLLDPDPALRRAGGVDALARELGASRVAAGAAYLFAEDLPAVPSPWFRAIRVLRVLPYRPRDLGRLLAEDPPGELVVKQRGLALDEAALRRGLPRAANGPRRVLVLWPDGKRRVACLGEGVDPR